MHRNEAKNEEIKLLAGEYKKNPNLFKRTTLVDSPELLKKFGIFIKNKQDFPSGYIKLWPQDFIVEEIAKNNQLQTIDVQEPFREKDLLQGTTIYATLVKCGLSTIEAVQELNSHLNKDFKMIQFAGIKDKDAITAQLISFRNTNKEELRKVNSPYLFLKDIYSGKGVVDIGSLKGNKFTILVRTNQSFKAKQFIENLERINKQGFSNFFYLQRFGTPRLINFNWGCSIMKGDYKKAVFSFLRSPGEREQDYFKKLRKTMEDNFENWEKIEEIMKPFPIIFQNEQKVVSYLKKNPHDFSGALNQIPEQIQLWLFAFASLLFNKKLSSYLEKEDEAPEQFPLILSGDENDWIFYEDLLNANGIFSLPLANLKPFPYVQRKKRAVKTKENAEILDFKIIKEGVIIEFILSKACYATTFLAHLFNLTSGAPPEDISHLSIDTKASLGKNSLEEVLNCFGDIIRSKTEDLLEKSSLE